MTHSKFPIVQLGLNNIPEQIIISRRDLTNIFGNHSAAKIMTRLNTGRKYNGFIYQSLHTSPPEAV